MIARAPPASRTAAAGADQRARPPRRGRRPAWGRDGASAGRGPASGAAAGVAPGSRRRFEFDVEEGAEIDIPEAAALDRRGCGEGLRGHRCHEVLDRGAAQHEEERGFVVEAGPDAIEDRRDMLAHRDPVRARAPKADLARPGKEPVRRRDQVRHHLRRQPPLEQFDDRGHAARAAIDQLLPAGRGDGIDFDPDVVDPRAADQCRHLPALDIEMDDRPVAQVGATPGEAVGVVGERLEVLAPRRAPERRGGVATCGQDRAERTTLLRRRARRLRRARATLVLRHVAVEARSAASRS